jgi:hypothetical protein
LALRVFGQSWSYIGGRRWHDVSTIGVDAVSARRDQATRQVLIRLASLGVRLCRAFFKSLVRL